MINIEFVESDKQKILTALRNVVGSIHFFSDECPRLLSVQFTTRVREDIISQAFVSKWSQRGQRYEEKYGEWKAENGLLGKGFWRLADDLITTLQSFKMNDGWESGIPSGIMDKGEKSYAKNKPKPIAMYASVLEYGLRDTDRGYYGAGFHPARPIFKYSLQNFAYNESPIIGERVLTKVALEWK
jgi:hypothetical protein